MSEDILEISPIIPPNWTFFAIENLAYHGHLVTVLYDQDGTRYRNDTGLTVFIDGEKVYNGNGTTASVPLAPTIISSFPMPINIAANPEGLGAFPQASATYTFMADNPYKAIDGYLFYDSIPDNRWTNYQSTSSNDTLKVHFSRPRNVSSITLALYSDVSRGGAIDVPSALEIYGSRGLLANITNHSFLANDRNTFTFKEVETDFLAVNMYNKPNQFVGVCEFEVWVPSNSSTKYYAVDALLTGAKVLNDENSSATLKGSVVGNLTTASVVAFSGIWSTGGKTLLGLSYTNSGTDVSVEIKINQVSQGNITLGNTNGSYKVTVVEAGLAKGNNFVTWLGGSKDLRYEILTASSI
jgi:hypothetical protein